MSKMRAGGRLVGACQETRGEGNEHVARRRGCLMGGGGGGDVTDTEDRVNSVTASDELC